MINTTEPFRPLDPTFATAKMSKTNTCEIVVVIAADRALS